MKKQYNRWVGLLLLAISLVSCGEVNTETRCMDGVFHKWGKWELTERPENFFKNIEVQRRTCEKCGYTMRESNGVK